MIASLLDVLAKLLDVIPTANEYRIGCEKTFLSGFVQEGFIDVVKQRKHSLDAFIRQGLASVLDLTEFCIGEHHLHNAFKDVTLARILLFDKLRYGWNILKKAFAHFFECSANTSGKVVENTVFNITVLNNVVDILGYEHQGLKVFGIRFHVVPKLTLSDLVSGIRQIGLDRIPFEFFK